MSVRLCHSTLVLAMLVLVAGSLAGCKKQSEKHMPLSTVYYYKSNVKAGEPFDPKALREGQMPATYVDGIPEIVVDKAVIDDLAGQPLRQDVQEGDLVRITHLLSK